MKRKIKYNQNKRWFILIIRKCTKEKILQKELKGCFQFFNKEINLDKQTKGYGLIRDKSPYHKEIASIASVGYGFAALIIGVGYHMKKHMIEQIKH